MPPNHKKSFIIENSATLLFEVHITTTQLSAKEIPAFEQFCHSIEAKPILIELSHGESFQQPMISKVFRFDHGEKIHKAIDTLVHDFKNANYPVSRVKIEVPLEIENQVQGIFPKSDNNYFEWHGKVSVKQESALKKICQTHNAHLSKNALKKDTSSKFITIRDYSSSNSIKNRIEQLRNELATGGWSFSKEEFEYCIYDSNEALDKGWIN